MISSFLSVHQVTRERNFVEPRYLMNFPRCKIGDNPNFGQLMMDQIRQSMTMATALALACFTDGTTSLERVFLTQLVRLFIVSRRWRVINSCTFALARRE